MVTQSESNLYFHNRLSKKIRDIAIQKRWNSLRLKRHSEYFLSLETEETFTTNACSLDKCNKYLFFIKEFRYYYLFMSRASFLPNITNDEETCTSDRVNVRASTENDSEGKSPATPSYFVSCAFLVLRVKPIQYYILPFTRFLSFPYVSTTFQSYRFYIRFNYKFH